MITINTPKLSRKLLISFDGDTVRKIASETRSISEDLTKIQCVTFVYLIYFMQHLVV